MFSWLEKNPFFFAVAVFIIIAYAGIVEILPDFANSARPIEGKQPYTTLQLAGHQAAEEREPDVFLWQGGGTEEAVKQENKR